MIYLIETFISYSVLVGWVSLILYLFAISQMKPQPKKRRAPEIYHYLIKVIRSCRTPEQLYSSRKWINNTMINFDLSLLEMKSLSDCFGDQLIWVCDNEK